MQKIAIRNAFLEHARAGGFAVRGAVELSMKADKPCRRWLGLDEGYQGYGCNVGLTSKEVNSLVRSALGSTFGGETAAGVSRDFGPPFIMERVAYEASAAEDAEGAGRRLYEAARELADALYAQVSSYRAAIEYIDRHGGAPAAMYLRPALYVLDHDLAGFDRVGKEYLAALSPEGLGAPYGQFLTALRAQSVE